MTVSSQTSRIEQLGDGTTTAFAVNFYFLENSDLKVFVNGGLQTITTNYTVTGAGNPAGGTVTFVSAPANGVQVVIFRDPALTQGLDYIDNDPFPAESHERGLDKLTMIAQRVKDLVSRALRLGDSVVGVSTELPALAGSQLLGTNPGGTGFQLYPLGSEPDTAANIVYTPSGTGAIATTAASKFGEVVSVFDHMTAAQIADVKANTALIDVTAAIQSALNTNKSVFFPYGTYLTSAVLTAGDNPWIYGSGVIDCQATNNNALNISGKSNVMVFGLTFKTSIPVQISGEISNGIFILNSSDISVQSCRFETSIYSAGVRMRDSTNIRVSDNYFTKPNLTPAVLGSPIFESVYVGNNCRDIAITGNNCFNEGQPIGVQCVSGFITDVTIANNTMSDCAGYGVYLYDIAPNGESKRITVQGNTIRNVYGTFLNTAVMAYSHGAGIYLQGLDDCTVTGNTIENCCVSTDNETLSPAGVAVAGGRNNLVQGNVITNSKRYGIILDGTSHTAIGNTVYESTKAAIYSRSSDSCVINGNTIGFNASTAQGILMVQVASSNHKRTAIVGNTIKNSINPIAGNNFFECMISNNMINSEGRASFSQGINFTSSSNNSIINNVVICNGGFGIREIGDRTTVANNTVIGAASGQSIRTNTNPFIYDNKIDAPAANDRTQQISIAAATMLDPLTFSDRVLINVTTTGTIEGIANGRMLPGTIVYLRVLSGTTLTNLGATAGNRFRFKNNTSRTEVADNTYIFALVGGGNGTAGILYEM